MASLAEMAAARGRTIDNSTLAAIKVQQIHYTKLHPSEMNFYGQKEIAEMADSIALAGIIQPLIVRKTDMGEYEVIVGHRRRLGAIKNVERGIKECEFLPCIEIKASDKIVQEIKKSTEITDREAEDIYVRYILIASNSINRELTDFERMEQAMELKVIIPYMRGDAALKGRALRAEIAKEMKRSTGQVGTYESIYNNLIPEGLERFRNEEIGISVAAGLASLPKEIQKQLVSKQDLRLADIEKAKEIRNGTVSESDTERTVQVSIPTRIENQFEEVENEIEEEMEENEPINLPLTEENKENAISFIFDECHDKSFPREKLAELIELFRQGKSAGFGFVSQQAIFEKLLPFENDVVKVTMDCGYKVDFVHTDEYIRIPVYPFWKKFEEYFRWMWQEEQSQTTEQAQTPLSVIQQTESQSAAVAPIPVQASYKINAYTDNNKVYDAYADNEEGALERAREFLGVADIRQITINIRR